MSKRKQKQEFQLAMAVLELTKVIIEMRKEQIKANRAQDRVNAVLKAFEDDETRRE